MSLVYLLMRAVTRLKHNRFSFLDYGLALLKISSPVFYRGIV